MNLDAFFNPAGVAIIGASADHTKLGYAVARNLTHIGYKGAIHLVNPKGGTLFELPIHAHIADIPDPVDLAICIVPAHAMPQTLTELGARGIHAAVITSGGFKESGPEGAALEAQCLDIARQHDIRLIGPNCVGLLDTHLPLDTTFLPPPAPARGDLAFLSHSGALCAAVIDWSHRQGFGFSRLISLGNQADLTETDLLPALIEDPNSKAICLYLETIADGQHFLDTARKCVPHKPILALKVGRTASGQKAASSHTGALASTDTAITAAFEKTGIIRAATLENLFDWARALAVLPLPDGNRTAILTNAGGPGVIAADALEASGLSLATLAPETVSALSTFLPPLASLHNPVDMLASATPDNYANALELLLADPGADSVILIIPPPPSYPAEDLAARLIPIIQTAAKPILVNLMGSELIHVAALAFQQHGIPTYPFPERAVSSLSQLVKRAEFLREIETVSPSAPGLDTGTIRHILETIQADAFDPSLAFQLMDSIGIQTAPVKLAASEKEAGQIAETLGFPLVAKIASKDILHKSDIGGVLLNIRSSEEAKSSFATLMERARQHRPDARLDGVTFQQQIPAGQDVIIGAVRDPQFGALMMFGSGGVDVEGLKDIAFALAPLTPHQAEIMLARTWAGRKLDGWRNIPAADKTAVIDALVRLSHLATQFPAIAEIEINPLRVLAKSVVAVDVRVMLK